MKATSVFAQTIPKHSSYTFQFPLPLHYRWDSFHPPVQNSCFHTLNVHIGFFDAEIEPRIRKCLRADFSASERIFGGICRLRLSILFFFAKINNLFIISKKKLYTLLGNYSTLFNPTTEAISVERKNIFQNETGSLKTKSEISTAPTAPIPVHTG